MSSSLVSHSPDLRRLEDEGYEIELRDSNLLVHHVPCVNAERQVVFVVLVSELSHNGEATITPATHEIWVAGAIPCDHMGNELPIVNQRAAHDFGRGLIADCSLSGKRKGQPPADYHDKISHYVDVLSQYARALNPDATAITFATHETAGESVFRYMDSATSRAGISAITAKLELNKVAIVGLGGTGSYILDQVSKTPVREIHLFDDDVLYAHNAFRAPGAARLEDLKAMPRKVDHLARQYDPLRSGIVTHPVRVDATNVHELHEMAFVFLSMDASPAKREIIASLVAHGIHFADVGMGVHRKDTSLGAMLRVTTCIPGFSGHVAERIAFTTEAAGEYDWNIQTADLNMLNAALAVIRWKKLFGYYIDSKKELNCVYSVSRNQLVNGNALD